MSTIWMVLLLALSSAGCVVANSPTVVQHNYGVVFNRVGGVTNGASVWRHTFALPWLNVSYPGQNGTSCITTRGNRFCDLLDDTKMRLEDHHAEVYLKVLADTEAIKEMIPVSMTQRDKRSAWFPWVGKVASSLFGLVN